MSSSVKFNPKCKYFLAVFYPESVASNWREVLDSRKVDYALSPLHEFDVKDDTGEVKKPHYHIIVYFHKHVALSTASNLFKSIGFTIPVIPRDLNQSYNYLTHKGFSDKYLYSDDDLEITSNFILEVDVDIITIIQYISYNQINTISQLTLSVMGDDNIEQKSKWLNIISSKAYFFKEFFNNL